LLRWGGNGVNRVIDVVCVQGLFGWRGWRDGFVRTEPSVRPFIDMRFERFITTGGCASAASRFMVADVDAATSMIGGVREDDPMTIQQPAMRIPDMSSIGRGRPRTVLDRFWTGGGQGLDTFGQGVDMMQNTLGTQLNEVLDTKGVPCVWTCPGFGGGCESAPGFPAGAMQVAIALPPAGGSSERGGALRFAAWAALLFPATAEAISGCGRRPVARAVYDGPTNVVIATCCVRPWRLLPSCRFKGVRRTAILTCGRAGSSRPPIQSE